MEFKKTRKHSSGQPNTTPSKRGNPASPQSQFVQRSVSNSSPSALQGDTSHETRDAPSSKIHPPPPQFTFTKRSVTISISIIVVAIASIAITATLLQRPSPSKTSAPENSQDKSIDDFKRKAILPSGKSISDLGGWKRISPPNGNSVFTFTDKINGVSIAVSQQLLPASFKTNTDTHIADLAKTYNATAAISAGDTKAYVGTSSKGPQSVIFTKNGLLILIKSQKKISDKAWAEYISGLK